MRIEALTFLRFAAAFIVVTFHYDRSNQLKNLAPGIFASATEMVTFFFVLSGFVLMVAYGQKHLSIRKYIANRVGRIWPVYLLALGIYLYFAITLSGQFFFLPTFLNIFLLQSWVSPYPLSLNFPGWSLSVEAFFYALFPLLIWGLRRYNPGWKKVLAASLVFWLGTQVILSYLLSSGFYTGYPSFSHDMIYYFPPAHLCSFLLGGSGGYWFISSAKNSAAARLLGKASGTLLLATLALLETKSYLFGFVGIALAPSFLAPFFSSS